MWKWGESKSFNAHSPQPTFTPAILIHRCIFMIMCLLILSLQAVGIFGHMTSKNPLDTGPGPDGGRSSNEDLSETFEKTVDLQSTTEEIEKSLEELESSIEETINKSGVVSDSKEPEPPHFTIATSPTRRTPPHKDE